MSSQQLSKVWSVVSLFLLYYALNTYLVTQGAGTIFGANLVMSAKMPAAFLGIPICAFVLLVASLIGIDYARKHGPRWADRIPVVGFEKINTTAVEAKLYQGLMLFILSLLPMLALLHFWGVVWGAGVMTTGKAPEMVPGGIWDWHALRSLNNPASICNNIPEGETLTCKDPATILPGLEPTIFAGLTVAAFAATLYFWSQIFLSSGPRKSGS